MVRNVDAFMWRWLGIVNGVRVPSGFSRTMAMCSRSRTLRKPSNSRARTTLCLGASTGNLGMRLSDEGVQDRRIAFESIRAERFQMEADGGLAIRQRCVR